MKLTKYANRGRPERWVLDFGKVAGKRKRQFFSDDKKAKSAFNKAVKQTKLHGTESLAAGLGLRLRYLEAEKRLSTVGASIEEAVDFLIQNRKRLDERVDVEVLIARCIEGKRAQGRRPHYLRQLKVAASRLPDDLLAHEINSSHVRALLESSSISPKTRNNWLADIRSIWRWGIDHGLTTLDPTAGIPRFADDRGEIEFLSVTQVKKVMETSPRDLMAFHALGVFAGIRPDEIRRMTWDDVRLDEGTATVRALSSKTRQRRVVELEPAAIAWLEPLFSREKQGLTLAIVQVHTDRLTDFRKTLDFPWPHDAMRHTYATFHFAHFRDERKLQANMGHRSGAMIFQHYRALASAKDAAAFWALRP